MLKNVAFAAKTCQTDSPCKIIQGLFLFDKNNFIVYKNKGGNKNAQT